MDGDSALTLQSQSVPQTADSAAAHDARTTTPLSYHQERLWFINQFETSHVYASSPTYHNIGVALRLDEPVDHALLEQALNAVVNRHAALRTNIILDGDVPIQTIQPTSALRLPPLERLDQGGDAWMPWAAALTAHSFRLDSDLLIRAALAELPPDQGLLHLTIHHAVADSASVRIIVEDLARAYTALCDGEPQAPAFDAIEYADYAEWQRGLTREELEPLLFYWKWQLRSPLPLLQLPEAKPRPAIHKYTAATHRFDIPERVAAHLRELVSVQHGTWSSALLAAFVALLRRYSNQDDIIVGVFAPCRGHEGTERLVGPLANLLPIRTRIDRDLSFESLLAQVTNTWDAALDHQDLPYEKLGLELNLAKDMSRTALFDVVFRCSDEDTSEVRFGPVSAHLVETNSGWGKYDLNLSVQQNGKGLLATLVYNAEIYDAGIAEQMMRHYGRLLEIVAGAPHDCIDDMMLLDPQEVTEQVVTFNATEATYPAESTLHQLFEEQTRRTPEHVALVAGSMRLTYAELNEWANRLADYLRRRGVEPECLVAVSLERSAELVMALLGVLKAGAAYLPIDPDHPKERRQFILNDAGARFLITTSVLQQPDALEVAGVVLLDSHAADIAVCSASTLANRTQPEHLAYCSYTSGSTGQPKGALIEHRNVVRLLVNQWLQFTFSDTDVWTLFHSAAFDFSVWEMYGALLYGGRLIVVPKAATRDPSLFSRLLLDEHVTVLNQTPSAFASLSQTLLEHGAPALSLRYVIFGGESLHPRELGAWRERYPTVRLINMYGITETTVHVTFKEITEQDIDTNVNNVGVPIPTTTVFVFDERLRLVPRGVAGEICVGGAGVGRGYLRRSELTATRFVVNPYRPPEMLYRSGDLGKLLPTGELVHLGRIDDQVQIRGFRVEPGEIRRHLHEHPLVAQADVVARPTESHDQQLVAYVVASGDLSASALRQHLSQRLPDYMLPSAFVFLKAFPLTPNGKVDRRALPEPDRAQSTSEAAFAPPRTPTEELMCSLWESTLDRTNLGVHDNFFELGGHSLLATQLFARIRDAFSIELPLRLLFENPTIASLSAQLDEAVGDTTVPAPPPIGRALRTDPLPLSFAQQRLWLLHQLDPAGSAYHVPVLFRVKGALDVQALRHSVAELLRRHESLRTAFRLDDRTPIQAIWDMVADPFCEVDLRGEPTADIETRALEIAQRHAWAPFDLGVPPLLRVTLVHLTDDDRLLVVTVHHIVSDEWSTGVFVGELTATYRDHVAGATSEVPDLPIQYADFAVWQRNWLCGDVVETLTRYWKNQLSGAPASIALPYDIPPALQQGARAGTQSFRVDEGTTRKLRAVSRESGATLFMTLFTAFAALLHRYSGQEDLSIGTPIANRRHTETESVIGFFVNTLVLRTDFSGRPTFRELLRRVRQVALDAYAHQDLPFEQVVEALRPDRTLSRTPLFQVMFGLQNARREQLDLPNVTVTPLALASRSAKFDLLMILAEDGGHLEGALEYNADAFSADVAHRIVEHFQMLLDAVALDPLQHVALIPLCSVDERRQLLGTWAGGTSDYPRNTTVHDAFESQVRKTPDALAVAFADEELTYRELSERANRLAHFLQPVLAQPNGRHHLVGICMEQSAEQVVSMLAILKNGAGYVPLDPDTPLERIAAILQDAEVSVLLTQERLLDRFATWNERGPADRRRIVCVDRDRDAIASYSADDPVTDTRASDLAYVIYTSGSTGAPKGVAVDHRAILRLVLNTNYVEVTAADRMAQASNPSFDAATFEIWGALLNGARLIGIDRQTILSPARFAEALRTQNITIMFLTASLFNEIARQEPDAFRGLKHLLVGGEALTPKWVSRVLERGRPEHLQNGYGPTENTTFSTWYDIEEVSDGAATIPIGTAIANTRTYVLDDQFEPVPPGIASELFLAGDGLAHGYLGQPALTAAAFLPNPWSAEPGERLYRTGDIVRTRADGAIEFVGRRDHQIKVRGFRIEPGEIEAALAMHPSVRVATVVSRPQGDLNPLIAYVVPDTSARDDELATTLHAFLANRLPVYMVPAAIVLLDELPLNANGKIDRGRLPAPDPRTSTEPAAPRTPTEELLCGLWADVLNLPEVGVNDDFYERGGHSLLATQLASRIRDTFAIELPLWRLFESTTPAALARYVDPARQAAPKLEAPLVPAHEDVPPTVSFAQERLWLLDQIVPGDPAYNVALAIRLTGRLEATALKRSLEAIVGRHDALRTTFANIGGKPVPRVHEAVAVDLPLVDLSGLTGDEQHDELQRVAAEEARGPFVLGRGPLLRASLVLLGEDSHVLLLTMHHIVSDGWSLGVLLREMAVVYSQIATGQPIALPELPLQYADFAYWQRKGLQGEVFQKQLHYWTRQLAGAPQLLALPTDRPRPRRETFRGSSEEIQLDLALADRLRELSRRSGTTLFMTLFAGFAALLQRYSGQDEFVIGTPVANRTRREIEGLIGFFVNTLVLRYDGSDNPTFDELLARVRTVALAAYDHQDLPFERLVQELRPERDLSRNPLFQVMFALQNAPMRLPVVPGLQMASLSTKRVAAQFDLVLDVWETPAGLPMVWEYNADLFDATTIRRMATHFEAILRAVTDRSALRVAALPLLNAAEQHQLLALGRGPSLTYPADRSIQDLFEEQVRSSPHRVAAVHGSERVTYTELNARANRIAHWLIRNGLEPNQYVAILEERGIDFLVAMLGVLKAGAAFLPIDPRYPSDRIRYMLRDSEVQTLIARQANDYDVHRVLSHDDLAARTDWPDEWAANPHRETLSTDVAYMLYTSGSTGAPKGALVRHNGAINHVFGQREALDLNEKIAFLQSAPSSSDISVWQFLAPLLLGGRTVIADFETVCDPASLFALIRSQDITLIELVPVVLQGLLRHVAGLAPAERSLPALRCAMVTGEVVQSAVVNEWFQHYPHIPMANAYGPTEAADDVCQALLTGPLDREQPNVPIGRPLANFQLLLLDRFSNLAVPHALGEICVAGVGVGAGYWRRDAQTQASFVSNPFAVDEFDTVIYRTGDLGRWRPDGLLELAGRMDDQVKINGFRIELGEIETVLAQHPQVEQAAVVVQHDDQGEKRLVAHIVPAAESDRMRNSRDQADQVATWESLHDKDYGQAAEPADATFNTIGWDSTYTAQAIPPEEMREYVDRTIERVLAWKPRKILEIGCGTGLLAFRLAPECDEYWGTDLSSVAVARLQALRGLMPADKSVTLLHRAAADFTDIPNDFDAVVINSVVQYFPSREYLVRTLENAVRSVRSGGVVFVGDVRDLRLLHAYHSSVQAYKAPASLPLRLLKQRVARQISQEQELFVHPEFFVAVQQHCPRVSRVRLEPKRGRFSNELTRFRFDVTLEIERSSDVAMAFPLERWTESLDSDRVRRRLVDERPLALGYRSVPNRRVQIESCLSEQLGGTLSDETVGDCTQAAAQRAGAGVDPEELFSLARDVGYSAEIRCSSDDPAAFDVLFHLQQGLVFDAEHGAKPVPLGSSLTNDPLREKFTRVFTSELLTYLKGRLPSHMIPMRVALPQALPLTPAGKVDRTALAAVALPPISTATEGDEPRTEVEKDLAEIWREVLGLAHVGVHDNFFDLGGHSLKATQVVNRIAQKRNVEVALRELFVHSTIAELAATIESQTVRTYRPIDRVPDSDHYPLSRAQSRLWVLSQFEAASRAYNMPAAVLLDGPLDRAAFERAVAGVVQRHESLRTTFTVIDGEPRQHIARERTAPITYVDLSGQASPEERARELANADAVAPFDLATGPLIRVSLLRLAATQHVAIFNLHHIIADDRSMHVLIGDFAELYGSPAAPPEPAERPVQYRDYAVWQTTMLRDDQGTRGDRRYWHDKLAGPRSVLNLRTDFRRPVEKTYNGASVYWNLGAAVTAALNDLCKRHGTTVFTALVAIVKTLLYRYTGQNDIILGSPVEGRTRRDLEDQVGFFVNMLVLRDHVDGDLSYVELLRRVRDSVTSALDHQNYPFDALVNELQPEHDVSRSPLFDVVVMLQNPDVQEFALPDVVVKPFGDPFTLSKYDLAFTFEQRADGLALVLVYNTDLFLPETAARMRNHLETLIASALADPGCPIGRLNLLPATERAQILRYSAKASDRDESPATIVERFVAQVRRSPSAVAVTDATGELTYHALNERANQCAHYLRAAGVEQNALVGICMDRSIEMIVGLLGILKAGAAYLPIDLNSPRERLAFVLKDAGIRVMLSRSDHAAEFAGLVPTIVCVDTDAASIRAQSTADPETSLIAADLAYVIYTSGSTGRPKGVLVTHANVSRLFTATEPWFQFSEADVWSLFHSYAFDFSVWEIWGALLYGGRLVVVPYWTSRSPDAFYELVQREQVTVLSQTPMAFRHFAEVERTLTSAGVLQLRLVVLGGEALDPTSLRSWFERHGDTPQVINMYGITETTVHVTYRPVGLADTNSTASMVGCAIPDLSLHVLDRYLQPVPFGVPGEIYVGGEGVARGYLHRGELTAQRFVPDPFGTAPGARLYRSGDLGCYRPNGDIEYLGRADDQVKIRGFRIELGEIASVLNGHDAVRECALIARAVDADDKQLVAYVVPATDPAPDVADLRAFLQVRLPDYMVPHRVVILRGVTTLPLTANGKLDRRAVPDATEIDVVPPRPDAQPRTALELAITEVWCDVLHVDAVDLASNFFELGGDSVAVVRVRGKLRETLGIDVPLTALFRSPTIRAFAEDLRRQETVDSGIAERARQRAQQQTEGRNRRQRRRTP